MPLIVGTRLVCTRFRRPLARAAWARSTRRATRGSTARSRSRFFRRNLPRDPQFRERFDREGRAVSALITHTSARSTMSASTRVRLPGHGVPRGRDARRAAGASRGPRCRSMTRCAIAVEIADALDKAHRARHRPSRPEARQRVAARSRPARRHADEPVGREASRLRTGEGDQRATTAGRRRHDAADAGAHWRKARSSARFSTWRPSRSKGRSGRADGHLRVRRVLYEMLTGSERLRGQEPGEPDWRDPRARAAAGPSLQPAPRRCWTKSSRRAWRRTRSIASKARTTCSCS